LAIIESELGGELSRQLAEQLVVAPEVVEGLNFEMSKKTHHNCNYYSATVACTSGAQSITIATVPFPET